ncbi:ABC transporter ATP-binding protein [Psychrobacter pygoscelis]|uniref:ABC transporter ATP-binding protein n=1 Tax=Psychrobacter pygoscelis TaxID=2488563 RepID=UPI001A9546D9
MTKHLATPTNPDSYVASRADNEAAAAKLAATNASDSARHSVESGNHYFSVQDMVVGYGELTVVDGMSFALQQGEIGCFLGYSGCGKTTALRAIAGLEPVRGGSIYLNDRCLTKHCSGEIYSVLPAKRSMGMVFQDYALFGHLSVAKNIAFGIHRSSKREQKARVSEMLELVGLTEHANKRPSQLSGGQQQRVALARALAPKPKLLLLDEPFSNLDVVLRESLAMSVRDILKRTQTTAILVTHDQNEAFALADKVGVMQDGRLIQWARPSTLYHEPNSPFVAEFIGEGAMITGTMRSNHIESALGPISLDPTLDPYHCNDDMTATPPKTFATGVTVKVLVRPDDIVHDDTSGMTALVVGRVFRGANYLYQLQLDDGQQVLSLVPSHHDHAIGSRIGIQPQLKHLVLFEESQVSKAYR